MTLIRVDCTKTAQLKVKVAEQKIPYSLKRVKAIHSNSLGPSVRHEVTFFQHHSFGNRETWGIFPDAFFQLQILDSDMYNVGLLEDEDVWVK
jgi:hypothetical protein